MKVLWFTNTPSLYAAGEHSYKGGGWIESLERELRKEIDIELGIAFLSKDDAREKHVENVKYFPLNSRQNSIMKLISRYRVRIENQNVNKNIIQLVNDFKPDLIHVFGTEGVFASLVVDLNVPVVIHLQGLITPYVNAFFPNSISIFSLIFNKYLLFDNLLGRGLYFQYLQMKKQAKREQYFLSRSKHIAGRTAWDKMISNLYACNASYYFIDEVLRPVFYYDHILNTPEDRLVIVTTISNTVYKGLDMILKTADLIMKHLDVKFVWKVIGISGEENMVSFFEKHLDINSSNVSIEYCGVLNENSLVEVLKNCSLFIHPSYIDNSPNSICEAQMMGLPVIACNAGGVGSLIEDRVTGYLVPTNAPHNIVSLVKEYSISSSEFILVGKKAKMIAEKRHDKNKIISATVSLYRKLFNDNNRFSY
jgi:glycosyltransferase involved in cell wall biosynthesis